MSKRWPRPIPKYEAARQALLARIWDSENELAARATEIGGLSRLKEAVAQVQRFEPPTRIVTITEVDELLARGQEALADALARMHRAAPGQELEPSTRPKWRREAKSHERRRARATQSRRMFHRLPKGSRRRQGG